MKYKFVAAVLCIFMLGTGAFAQAPAEFMHRGEAAFKEKNFAVAVENYTKAIAADPANRSAFQKRRDAYNNLQQYDKCLADANDVIRLKQEPASYLVRGQIYAKLHQLERGIEDATVAIQLKPDYSDAYRWRAQAFKSTDKFDRGLEDINAVIKMGQVTAADYDLRSELNRYLDKCDLSLADANQAIKMQPNFAHAYCNRAWGNYQQGKYTLAINDIQESIKLDPKMAEAYSCLTLCDERLGRYEKALEDTRTSITLNPQSANYVAALGVMLIRTGDLVAGEQALQKAAKIRENNASVIFGTALLQVKHHDIVAAGEYLGKLRSWIDRYDPLGRQRPREAQLLLEMNRPKDVLDALSKMKMTSSVNDAAEKLALQSCAHRLLGESRLSDLEISQARVMVPDSFFVDELARGTACTLNASTASRATASLSTPGNNLSNSAGAARNINTSAGKPVTNVPVRDKWALVIGVSQFAHPQYNLRYSAKDALDFYHYLINEAHFPKDHVLLLLNEQATRLNIMNAFGDQFLPAVSEPDDMVVIFVSTHGTPAARDKGGRNYIVAYDTDSSELYATGVDMDELYRRLREGVKTDRALIIMDACYSGAGVPGAKALNAADSFDANQIALGCGHLVLSSSSPKERSWESTVSANGVFTKYLLSSLRENKAMTDIKSAFEKTKKEVSWEVKSSYGESQMPQLGGNWEGKELVLSVSPSESRQIFNPSLLKWIRSCAAAAAAPAGTAPGSAGKTGSKTSGSAPARVPGKTH